MANSAATPTRTPSPAASSCRSSRLAYERKQYDAALPLLQKAEYKAPPCSTSPPRPFC
ncbi:MAG: hypothetical protein KDD27_01260 [Saprospiraceae bacterium]|nr:hypothetical protein [Saprospiraceae bacterium]